MARLTTAYAQSPPRGMPIPLRHQLTLVVVPFVTLALLCILVAVLESDLNTALAWFHVGLTVAAVGACVTVVVIALDKNRWARVATAEAIADTALAQLRLKEATVQFECQLDQARVASAAQFDALILQFAERKAVEAITQTTPENARMTLRSGGKTYTWTRGS